MGGYPLCTLFVNSVPVVALSRDERWFDEREMKSKKKKKEEEKGKLYSKLCTRCLFYCNGNGRLNFSRRRWRWDGMRRGGEREKREREYRSRFFDDTKINSIPLNNKISLSMGKGSRDDGNYRWLINRVINRVRSYRSDAREKNLYTNF